MAGGGYPCGARSPHGQLCTRSRRQAHAETVPAVTPPCSRRSPTNHFPREFRASARLNPFPCPFSHNVPPHARSGPADMPPTDREEGLSATCRQSSSGHCRGDPTETEHWGEGQKCRDKSDHRDGFCPSRHGSAFVGARATPLMSVAASATARATLASPAGQPTGQSHAIMLSLSQELY